MGAALAQHIAEQHLLQFFRRDGGIFYLRGDLHRFTGLRSVQLLLHRHGIKADADLLNGDAFYFLIVGRVLHFTGQFVVDVLRRHHGGGELLPCQLYPVAILTVRRNIRQRSTDGFRLDRTAVTGTGHKDVSLFKLIAAVNRLLRKEGRHIRASPVQRFLLHIRPVVSTGVTPRPVAQILPAFQQEGGVLFLFHPESRITGKALCRVAEIRYRNGQLGIQRVVGDLDPLRQQLRFQLFLRLLHGQAAHVNAVDMVVGIKRVQRICVGAQPRIGPDQKHCQYQQYDPDLFAFFLRRLRLHGFHDGFIDLFHGSPPVVTMNWGTVCPPHSVCCQFFILAHLFQKRITIP